MGGDIRELSMSLGCDRIALGSPSSRFFNPVL